MGLPSSLLFADRIFSRPPAFISRAPGTEQSRLSSNSTPLTRRDGDGARANVSNHRGIDHPPSAEGDAGRIDRTDRREDNRRDNDLSRENARHECGTLWCVRGTVVCTLNSVGTPHPLPWRSVVCHCVRLRARAPTQPRDTWACCGTRGTGWTGRDREKDRDGRAESAEVRQKRRDSVMGTERRREMEEEGREVVWGGGTGRACVSLRETERNSTRARERERPLCTGRQETRTRMRHGR